MELIEGVIIVFAVSLCSIVVHRVYRFAMRGKTYEEAIAEQRKLPSEYTLLGRGKDKNKDKKTKKVGKKAKEKPIEKEKADVQTKVASNASVKGDQVQKSSTVTGSKVETVAKASTNASAVKPSALASSVAHSDKHRAVEFGKPEAEFVNDQGSSQDEGKAKKKKKADKGVKPILLNRDEVSPVDVSLIKDEPETPRTVNHFEESKPKDEFLKRKHSKEETGNPVLKSKEKSKASINDKAPSPSDHLQSETSDSKVKVLDGEKEHKHEEKVQVSHIHASASQPTPTVTSVTQPEKEVNVQEPVQEEVEVQVTQQLQTAPAAASSSQETKRKKKKNDLLTLQQMAGPGGVNISLLEPLIRKADLSRSEVQNLIDLLLNKQQESATEDSEWTEGRQDPVVKLKKQLAEREKSLAEEQEASQQWQVKVRELRTELNGERTRLGSTVRKLEGSMEKLTVKMQNESESHAEEKRGLLAKVQELQNKLSEDHMKHCKMQEQEQQTVAALQQELHGHHSQLEVHMSRLRDQNEVEKEKMLADISRLQEEVKSHEESRVMHSTELRQAQDKLSALQSSSSESEDECKRLREVAANAEAAAQIAVSDANAAREMAHRIKEDSQKSCIEREQQLAELKAVTSAQKMRETELEAEVSRVKSEGEAEKERLHASLSEAEERVRRVKEALAKAEAQRVAGEQVESESQSSHQRLFQEKDAFIQQLGEELSYYKTEIPKLSEALEVQRKKNDELRQKNWKAMEALTATENTLKAHLKNSQTIVIEDSQKAILEEQEGVKRLLQRLFPSITVENVESHSEWVKMFEASACESLKTASEPKEPPKCDTHQKEIQELQARVTHYLNIVKETETMLSNLQNTVESQELTWSQQLAKKEEELKQVASERDDLVVTLEELQSTTSPATADSETQEKVQKLESRLILVEEEKQKLSAHCDNLQGTHSDLEKEFMIALKTVEDLQKDVSTLTTELNRRQEQNDDLSKEVVKLNSLVKIGQASLSQEQVQIKEMEEELEKLKAQPQNHTATNGPANESSISETTKPVSVKRRRLSGWFSKKLMSRKKVKSPIDSSSESKKGKE